MNSDESTSRRRLSLNISDVEMAFELTSDLDTGMTDYPNHAYLDLETGRVVWPETEEENEDYFADDRFLEVPMDENRMEYRDLEDFTRSLADGPRRRELSEAIQGRGAFRRFKAVVHGSGDIELQHAWNWFQTRRLRERIISWLEDAGIEPEWDCDVFRPHSLPNRRPDLLRAALEFVRRARQLAGVGDIALLGSLATDKPQPKDVDLLVVMDETIPLGPLAKLSRKLLAKTMQTGHSCGTDVFLVTPAGEYVGRVCQWKECCPGIRMACQAQHCGRREFLYDDLQNVWLTPETIARPPIKLWPNPGPIDTKTPVPQDVNEILLEPLKKDFSLES